MFSTMAKVESQGLKEVTHAEPQRRGENRKRIITSASLRLCVRLFKNQSYETGPRRSDLDHPIGFSRILIRCPAFTFSRVVFLPLGQVTSSFSMMSESPMPMWIRFAF